jgi:hypothetical protein
VRIYDNLRASLVTSVPPGRPWSRRIYWRKSAPEAQVLEADDSVASDKDLSAFPRETLTFMEKDSEEAKQREAYARAVASVATAQQRQPERLRSKLLQRLRRLKVD